MKTSPWLGIGVGTLVGAISMWFGFLAMSTDVTVGLGIIGVGLAFAMYAIAGFSGVADVQSAGFRGAIVALVSATAALVIFQTSGVQAFAVAAPVLGLGFGASYALEPVDDSVRSWTRVAFVVGIAVAITWIYRVDHTVYGLVAPLLPLPVIGIADVLYQRGREVVAETAGD